MIVIVSYDITDDRNRLKIFKYLKEYGIPVQKSVFEIDADIETLKKMKLYLSGFVEDENDSIRFYRICEKCVARTMISGWGEKLLKKHFEVI